MKELSSRPLENIATRASELIGRTPLFELCSTESGTRLLLKLEQFNPTGSTKVRMAAQMINDAERCGQLRPGGHIIEPTSGNTGLGLALVAIERGYRFTAVVDHHACEKKLQAMAAMGAELIYVGEDSTNGSNTAERRKIARELATVEEGACLLDQHNNPGNCEGYRELAHDLLADIFGDVDYLISPIGTGGSLCGTTKELRRLGSRVVTIGVEPDTPDRRYGQANSGSPKDFPIGSNIDFSLIDDRVQVADVEAFAAARMVTRRTGLMIGGTSGGAAHVALQRLATLPPDSTVVTLVSDAGEKYLDTVFDNEWMRERDLLDPVAEQQVQHLLDRYTSSAHVPRGDIIKTRLFV
jgi:cystathionine beta-synthase